MCPYDGFDWYLANIDTIVARSGRVACDNQIRDLTMDQSSDDKRWRSSVVNLFVGTESTGWPVRYGVEVMVASVRFIDEISCSANACWDK